MSGEVITGYRMLEQIRDSGRAVRLALEAPFRDAVAVAAEELLSIGARRVYATGCGTSLHAAIHARYVLRHLAAIDVGTVSTSDLLLTPPADLCEVPLLVYSHSGVSKATVDAASAAKGISPQVVAFLNVDDTPLTRAVDRTLVVPGGRDSAMAKSKSFTTTMLANVLFALELGQRRGVVDGIEVQRWEDRLAAVPSVIDAAVGLEGAIDAYLARSGQVGYWFFVGSNVNSVIALEAALKMKEANYATAEGYEAEEAGHGRIQPVDSATMVVAFATDPLIDARLLDIVRASRATGARVTVVAPADEALLSPEADEVLVVPTVEHALLSPLVNVIPAQLLAYQLAVSLGYNPDLIRTDDPRYARANGIVFPPGTH